MLDLERLTPQDLDGLSATLMAGFKKVVEQQVLNKVARTVPQSQEEDDEEIEVDIDLIEKIQIDANYKIDSLIQHYAQQVKVNIHQLHSQNTFKAKSLYEQLEDPSLKLTL